MNIIRGVITNMLTILAQFNNPLAINIIIINKERISIAIKVYFKLLYVFGGIHLHNPINNIIEKLNIIRVQIHDK